MKYLLILQGGRTDGHERFRRIAEDAGELVDGHIVADPSTGVLLGGARPLGLRAYYLVDVESGERATELARLLPEPDVEIRPVMLPTGVEY